MTSLYTEIVINAPKQRRLAKHCSRKTNGKHWNTFLYDRNSNVPFRQGNEVCLSVRRIPYEDETEIEPLVIQVQPNFCLSWVSSFLAFAMSMCLSCKRLVWVVPNIFTKIIIQVS
jgi:hypothetical protein